MNIGEHMKALRKLNKMSQQNLADKAGLSLMSIRRYESGEREPKPAVLVKIADALGVPLIDLMDISSEEKKEMEDFAEYIAQSVGVSKEVIMKLQIVDKLHPSPAKVLNDIEDAADAAIVEQYKTLTDSQLQEMCEESIQYLNRLGRIEAARRLYELTEIPKYQKRTDGD